MTNIPQLEEKIPKYKIPKYKPPKYTRNHTEDCECLFNGPGEIYECTCNFRIYVSLDNMIDDMRNENTIDNCFVISEGRLRDFVEKHFLK